MLIFSKIKFRGENWFFRIITLDMNSHNLQEMFLQLQLLGDTFHGIQ